MRLRRIAPGIVMFGIMGSLFFACGDQDDPKEEASVEDGNGTEAGGDTQTDVCQDEGSAKGDRLLGMDILNPSESGTFEESLAQARDLGVSYLALHVTWLSLEPQPGEFTDPDGSLAALADVAAVNDLKLSITIRPIDLTGKTVPSDLATTRFNDPVLKTRFKALLDFVLTKVPASRLVSLQLGNEIDGYDTGGEHPDFWSDYGSFLFDMTAYLHEKAPGLKVGFTGTAAGMTAGVLKDQGVFAALADVVDVVGVTYYPLDDQYVPKDPGVIKADFAQLVSTFAGRPIYLQEVGYPTPQGDPQAEEKQAEFYCNLFREWDANPAIKVVEIVRLQDISPAAATEMAGPYGVGSATFIEYLQRLGIRTYAGKGQDKKAVAVIRRQAELRGF